ncbi:cell wall-binding repeat-containing protein [Mediannikoviicoccus vaginalis]|uniref:cell wall-binding repeat-containing protein n=1 Tax=Mediannikoviicoccus vaginalis TaxID=2899727 RepID=UPI001F46E335|nr:cell wall-binding repeat-containing protein [Mediannikoviicoccus vaginalis]
MKKKIFSVLLGTSIVLSSFSISEAATQPEVKRLSGTNRYSTSVAVSKAYYENSKEVVVASGEGFADALVGGTLSAQLDAPLLLTSSKALPEDVKNEISRLGVEKIYLLGGADTVKPEVESKLSEIASVKRLSGKNRFETAREIGRERLAIAKTEEHHIAAVDGFEFPDALASAPFVGRFGSENSKLTLLLPFSSDLKPDYIVGGGNSVKYDGEILKRFKGSDRVDTSLEIAKNYEEFLGITPKTLIVVNGDDYPDALSAVSASKALDAPIVLNRGKVVSKNLASYIENNEIEKVIVIGGEGSVPNSVYQELVTGKPFEEPTEPTKPVEPTEPTEPTENPNDVVTNPSGVPMDLDKLWVDSNGRGLIKGNINRKGEKIYHVPGQAAYNRTGINPRRGERWFKTEREAQKAGWRRAEK